MERGNKATVRTSRGDAIEMKGWTDGGSVRVVFVSIVCDCHVGLLHLVESKEKKYNELMKVKDWHMFVRV